MIIVAGITRSGMTLTMQMLNAGGVKCAGEYPAFECFGIGDIPWTSLGDYAVKAVDTHLQNPPLSGCKVIRLRRNLVEQCKSINKWNAALIGLPPVDDGRLKSSLIREYRTIDAWAAGHQSLIVDFESVIRHPLEAAVRIQQFLDVTLDIDAMKSVVIDRDTSCFNGLLELTMLPDSSE